MINNLGDADEYFSQKITNIDMAAEKITCKEFEGCTFIDCDFSETVIEDSRFIDCEFSGCNLSLITIEQSRFSDVEFNDCKIVGVNWTSAVWPRIAHSSLLRFYKSIISDSGFFGLKLPEIVIEECKAHNVDFGNCDFSDSNFSYTDFLNSVFDNTNLTGVDFSEALNYDIDIYNNLIKNAKFSRFEAVRLLKSLGIKLID